jgi:hypothetical protein
MRLEIIFIILFIVYGLNSFGQKTENLEFRNGEFKIIQFTDLHINQKKENLQIILSVVKEIIINENIDLAVFTGDIVTEKNPKDAFEKIADLMSELKTKWTVVLGNHDDEYGTKRIEVAEMLTTLPYCLNKTSEYATGATNFTLKVGKGRKRAILYFMDSNAYSTLEPKVEGYGWFDISQIQWYKEQSKKFTDSNKGKPLPALAFFHIPLPEYNQVWDSKAIKKFGKKNEKVCCPDINTGMFAAMVEGGDIMGTFVGHDHVNDYIGVLYEIALAYGRCSGMENAYGELPPGGRVVVLKEGKRKFETWIHELDGTLTQKSTYPNSFR